MRLTDSHLARLRMRAQLTQPKAAEALGVHQTTISDWERGEHPPDNSRLPLICSVYGCTPPELERALAHDSEAYLRRLKSWRRRRTA